MSSVGSCQVVGHLRLSQVVNYCPSSSDLEKGHKFQSYIPCKLTYQKPQFLIPFTVFSNLVNSLCKRISLQIVIISCEYARHMYAGLSDTKPTQHQINTGQLFNLILRHTIFDHVTLIYYIELYSKYLQQTSSTRLNL